MPIKESFRRLIGRPGTVDQRRHQRLVQAAGQLEPALQKLTDEELHGACDALREGSGPSGFGNAELAEVCALGREAARRTLGERPFDVQLLGTGGLLSGSVVEMATGEGKTLSGALAAAGFALQGRHVQLLTVNDYLAARDANWMQPLLALMGVSVGWVTQHSSRQQRREAYAGSVCYVSVNEVGFDVLRDRLCTDAAELVLGEPDVVIIDEADAVLIDEARVPLVLAAGEGVGDDIGAAAGVVAELSAADYDADPGGAAVNLTDAGIEHAENLLGVDNLYAVGQGDLLTQLNVALYAQVLLQRDVDYLVLDGQVRLVDDNRGRVADRQRWPDGLQAAVEEKEGLKLSERGQILDSILVQKLIEGYRTICGMTGTAVVVSEQLREFYQLEAGAVPTNLPCIRSDEPDRMYATTEAKEQAIVDLVAEAHHTGRPVLLGTQDIAESERLAALLRARDIKPAVLNAKNDSREAAIVAEAGAYAAVTVSTQMAGRGTDIRLGGADEAGHDRVVGLSGLLVIGTSRYHTSRLDDQLRGRAGRQGDPGGSVIFVSLEDPLITRYAPDVPDETPAEDGQLDSVAVRRHIDHAQRVAEAAWMSTHRTTWRYHQQIQAQRDEVLGYRHQVLHADRAALELSESCPQRWADLAESVPGPQLAEAARLIVLYQLDQLWAEQLAFTAELREGIHLRVLGRQDPLQAFHREAANAFRGFAARVRSRAAEAFEGATITSEGLDVGASGVKRPSSTWTYLVNDNPFGSAGDHVLRSLGNLIRGGR